MKYLPTDVNSFNTSITPRYLYVDKTRTSLSSADRAPSQFNHALKSKFI